MSVDSNGDGNSAQEQQTTSSQAQRQPKQRNQPDVLPTVELAAYLICFVAALLAGGYAFLEHVGDHSIPDLDPTTLRTGFFGFKMDNTYLDFNYFLSNFGQMLAVLTGHLVVSQATLRFCSLQLHHLSCATFTLALSCCLLSAKCTAMLLSLHGCCQLAGCTGFPLAVWSAVLVSFLQFSGASFGSRELHTRLGLDARGAHLFYPISGYLYCRFLSMGLCLSARTNSRSPPQQRPDSGLLRRLARCLPESLHYAFYLPNFLGGPVVTMDDFLSQRQQALGPDNLRQCALRAARLVLWLCVTLAIVHCFPVGAYLETIGLRLVRRAEPIGFARLAFAMYARGQLFMLEYVQYYGWPGLFASLDGLRLPHWPACICRVTSYREMWRLFDRGLFSIVRDHVYIPLGGSRRGLGRQLGATAASFGFICLYHGNYDSVQAWILLNLALVAAEIAALRAYRGGLEAALLSLAGPRWLRRFAGFLAAANLIPPSVGIFYFFYGNYAGRLVMREILWKPLTGQSALLPFIVFYAAFYFSVQLAMEYKLRRAADSRD